MDFWSLLVNKGSSYLSDFLSLCKHQKVLLQTLLIFSMTTEIRGQQTFSVKGQIVNISGLWFTSRLCHIFSYVLVILFFCSRTSYDSPVIMKAYRDLKQSLKAIFDLALICVSKLFLVLSPFCNLCSSQIEYLKSDRDPTLTSASHSL